MMFKPRLTPDTGFSVLESTDRSQAATMVLQPQQSTGGPNNEHTVVDQWLYVLSGEGRAVIGNETAELGPGALLLIEAREKHEIRDVGERPLETINFYAPATY